MITRKEQHKLMKKIKNKKEKLNMSWKDVAKVPEINTLADLRLYLQGKKILTNEENLIDKLKQWLYQS